LAFLVTCPPTPPPPFQKGLSGAGRKIPFLAGRGKSVYFCQWGARDGGSMMLAINSLLRGAT